MVPIVKVAAPVFNILAVALTRRTAPHHELPFTSVWKEFAVVVSGMSKESTEKDIFISAEVEVSFHPETPAT